MMYSYATHLIMTIIVIFGVLGVLTFLATRENKQPIYITPFPAWTSWLLYFTLMLVLFLALGHSLTHR